MLNMTELEKVQVLYAHFTGSAYIESLKQTGQSWYPSITELFDLVRELIEVQEEDDDQITYA